MLMKFQFDNGAMEQIYRLCDRAFETKLGPMMKAEVKKNTPVDTGSLRDSVDDVINRAEHKLYIVASGNPVRGSADRADYAAWVDLGHRVFAWGHATGKVKAPTAFMRRALYRRYPGF